MKRLFLWGVLIALLVAAVAWFLLRNNRVAETVQSAVIARGDLVVTAAASGVIEADVQVDVKSRASGTVIDIPAVPGETVSIGELLVRLDPEDEEQNVLSVSVR